MGAPWPSTAWAAEDDVLVEIHFEPVPGAQIAIWLEDAEGRFVQDVFVTQATGRLGIGNRPGRWDFLSSWRFPYGPRTGVLPVWAHARGRTYPKLVFHDDDPADQESLGWHENTSSPEPYFCRPLAEAEHDTISTDTMTCPSPATFQSDKGRFLAGESSVYPPRNDLTSFEAGHDSDDVPQLSELNDLDAITGATPMGNRPELVTTVVSAERVGQGPLVARIEINLEHDENPDWDFSRDGDHYVDPRLESYGIEYMGQPSIVYQVQFDPENAEFAGTDAYAGYGELDGATGTLSPPDASISTTDGSGADRLHLYSLNGETFRFGVYSHGPGSAGDDPKPPNDDGWGVCTIQQLAPMSEVEFEPIDFDTVRVHFTVPPQPSDMDITNAVLYYRQGQEPITDDNASSALQQVPSIEQCSGEIVPGEPAWCELTELFGNYDYQIGIAYEDVCGNLSSISTGDVRTPAQQFAQVDGFCFVATAAWGAPWAERVQALRWFRDRYLKSQPMGAAFVAFYYSSSPPLARMIARSPLARGIARTMLQPLTDIALATTHQP
ncbi:MAG: hypothetical protein KDK70_35705 [Myxococcales bacterium]|nr:hypothetical protein [Myxococcales bacterium]